MIDARNLINTLCVNDTSGSVRYEYDFGKLKSKINKLYDPAWLPEVFPWVAEAIDISKTSDL
jgi:hypothetical protein